MKQWWESVSERERLMLGVAAVFLFAAGVYFFIFAPLADRFVSLRKNLPEKRQELAWMKEAAREVRSLRKEDGQGPVVESGGSVMTVIDKTAKQVGLGGQLKRIEPEGQDGAKVWLEDVPHDDIMRWLYNLQMKYGVAVDSLSLEAAELQGHVKARLTLVRRAE